jgi:hypothetical protein
MAPQIDRPENLFEGFNPADCEDEARERWPEQFEQAQAVAPAASAEQVTAGQKEITAQLIRMAELMTAGQPPLTRRSRPRSASTTAGWRGIGLPRRRLTATWASCTWTTSGSGPATSRSPLAWPPTSGTR